MSISLHELAERIGDDPSLESLMALTGLYAEYVETIDNCATEIMSDLPNRDLKAAIDIIRSVAIADALGDGLLNRQQLQFLMSDTFSGMAATIFKLSVGLAAMEEWR